MNIAQLCNEIDPSWTPEEVDKIRGDLMCIEHGFIRIRPIDGWVHLDMIAVDPEHRGKGHGRALVEIAEDVARTMDFRGIVVETIEPEFFSHLGFKVLGLLPGLARGRDLTVMCKEIK